MMYWLKVVFILDFFRYYYCMYMPIIKLFIIIASRSWAPHYNNALRLSKAQILPTPTQIQRNCPRHHEDHLRVPVDSQSQIKCHPSKDESSCQRPVYCSTPSPFKACPIHNTVHCACICPGGLFPYQWKLDTGHVRNPRSRDNFCSRAKPVEELIKDGNFCG